MVLHGQTLMVPAGMPTPDDKWAQDVATAFSATAVDGPLAAALRDSVGGAVDDALAASLEAVAGRACTVIDPATARDERVAAGRVLLVAGGHAACFDDGVSRKKHAHAVLVSRCGVVRCGRAILSVESETRRFARTLDAASDQLMRVRRAASAARRRQGRVPATRRGGRRAERRRRCRFTRRPDSVRRRRREHGRGPARRPGRPPARDDDRAAAAAGHGPRRRDGLLGPRVGAVAGHGRPVVIRGAGRRPYG